MFEGIMQQTALKVAEDKAVFNEGDYYKPYFKDSDEYKVIYCGRCRKPKESFPYIPAKPTLEGERPLLEGGKFVFNNTPVKIKCLCQCEVDNKRTYDNEVALRSKATQLKLNCWGYLDYSYSIPKKTRCIELEKIVFSEYEHNKHIKSCKGYLSKLSSMVEQGMGLYLCGTSGAGKTIAIMCLANELMDRGFSVRFKQQLEITSLKQYEDTDEINNLMSCSFLIIDDFNPYLASDYGVEMLFSIIDQRINRHKITMFTSNIPKAKLSVTDGDKNKRLLDRIVKQCFLIEDSKHNYRTEL